jgi:hypothetical protein
VFRIVSILAWYVRVCHYKLTQYDSALTDITCQYYNVSVCVVENVIILQNLVETILNANPVDRAAVANFSIDGAAQGEAEEQILGLIEEQYAVS